MKSPPWTDLDLEQMRELGMDPQGVARQLELFRAPPPFAVLDRPAVLGDGILKLGKEEIQECLDHWETAGQRGRFLKFVPASGAASRMFHLLSKFSARPSLTRNDLLAGAGPEGEKGQVLAFLDDLPRAAFWEELRTAGKGLGADVHALWKDGKYGDLLRILLSSEGLDYSRKPKGLIPFHLYPAGARTAFAEHLVEAASVIADSDKRCRVHFTVSPDHREECRRHLESLQDPLRKGLGVQFDTSFSIQEPSSNTLAVDERNDPFRDGNGRLLFRPAGHGALIRNLDELKGDILFVKNIDNVSVEGSIETTVLWKKILAGRLVKAQEGIFSRLRRLNSGRLEEKELDEIRVFSEKELSIRFPAEFPSWNRSKKSEFVRRLLDRPLRVCGVVANTGEPGGGPFWVKKTGLEASLQIVESAQVDPQNNDQKALFKSSTHFNPVDLVCGVRDWRGKSFDLGAYVDPDAVFISRKSHEGRELKALELPGLWNGAMANWITLFVEVPLETFNPVKTVFDLLKPAHRARI